MRSSPNLNTCIVTNPIVNEPTQYGNIEPAALLLLNFEWNKFSDISRLLRCQTKRARHLTSL